MPASAAPACGLTLVAWRMADLTSPELWWRYIGLGGNLVPDALADYLAGTARWPAVEHNVLAQVLNERLWDLGCPTLVPYRPPKSRMHGTRRAPG
ncbi:hypothetical protein GCM10027451_19810 [Geodermatophilus aquaeductus]|uniref:Uncharacterized protein n=1 Tax=Geodermatophilus aquaeductus TaxID=1564161 RepID=A0A521EB23_9ACTN|nr:hypothetical protein [Geodermatophilus aquaeductus]SMO81113.1 hypothetical protein SAMN06273567_104395 [Geodermatophilus aquaeductus]